MESTDAHLLIARLHRVALLRISARLGYKIQGLSIGANRLGLPSRWKRKCRDIDAALGLAEKISRESIDAFLADLDAEMALVQGLNKDAGSKFGGGKITHSSPDGGCEFGGDTVSDSSSDGGGIFGSAPEGGNYECGKSADLMEGAMEDSGIVEETGNIEENSIIEESGIFEDGSSQIVDDDPDCAEDFKNDDEVVAVGPLET